MNHADAAPSAWVRRFAALIEPRGTVLDLACGSGRHLRWLAAQGFAVIGVERDAAAVKLKFRRLRPEFTCSIKHLRWISGWTF